MLGWKFLPGNSAHYDLAQIPRSTFRDFEGMNLFALGSSVTWGFASGGVGLAEYLAHRYAMTAVKEAVNGTTLAGHDADSYVARLHKHSTSTDTVDLFLLQLSTNDARKGYSTAESMRAVEDIITYVHQQWQAPVIVYTNTRFASNAYGKLVDALHETQRRRGDFFIIDLWNNEQLNTVTSAQHNLYMADDIHPTRAGYVQWWGPYVAQKLEEIMSAARA